MKKSASKKPVKKTSKRVRKTITLPPMPPAVNPSQQAIGEAEKAIAAGKWLIASFRVEDGKMTLDRTALNFPKDEIALACKLFVENLEALKGQ